MLLNEFTLIDAFNQFWKVCGDGDRRALTSAGLTYYYLCNVWNTCGRPVSFRRQNNLICAELMVSKPTLEKHRNVLKQSGLIDFFSKGKGDPNITYKIIDLGIVIRKKGPPPASPPEPEKEKIFTSGFTSPFTSGDDIKQSKDLFIVVDKEVKNFYYLKKLFEQDQGLLMKWKGNGYPPEKFSEGVEQWMMLANGKEYHDFEKARNHFFFWLPNYSNTKQDSDVSKANQRNAAQSKFEATGNSNYAGGF